MALTSFQDTPIHGSTDQPLGVLLSAWNQHQDLHFAGAPVEDLAASRMRLDQARALTSIQNAA